MRVQLEILAGSPLAQISHPLVLFWMRYKNLSELGVTTRIQELQDDEAAILEFCEVVYSNAKARKR